MDGIHSKIMQGMRGDTMTLWSRFIAWFSGRPVSKERKSEKELAYLFEEEEELKKKVKVKKKPKGLNPKKKKSRR